MGDDGVETGAAAQGSPGGEDRGLGPASAPGAGSGPRGKAPSSPGRRSRPATGAASAPAAQAERSGAPPGPDAGRRGGPGGAAVGPGHEVGPVRARLWSSGRRGVAFAALAALLGMAAAEADAPRASAEAPAPEAPAPEAPAAVALPAPPSGFAAPDPGLVAVGRLLFYDPVLSGGRGVSCASCHNPRFGTSDGLSLGLGDGASGLGPERRADPANLPERRVPRNAPALFNLGYAEFDTFFHDGRLEADPARPSGIRTPLGEDMARGFASALSAQAMFPVLAPDEMAGHYGESEVSRLVRQGLLAHKGGAWDAIAARVAAIPAYAQALGEPVRFTAIADALAAFVAFEWRADDSPFDRHLRGEAPLTGPAAEGMALFYGRAGCSACHAGAFQTDHGFHAIAMPQIGPGKGERFETHARDEGRMRVTGAPSDAYRFRTPSLRGVALSAPYGHSGAYATLEGVVRHHLDPVGALRAYDPSQAVLPELPGAEDFRVTDDPAELDAIAAANELEPMALGDAEVAALLAFLDALTDETAASGRLGVPDAVPSGLPVER